AGAVLTGATTLAQTGAALHRQVLATAAGRPTASESLGHQEFILTYKSFTPLGPGCLPN
ncbi:MAG: UxaA family hydrolase, partial [Planctomycetes bacterium]|nr:UxaA family hydrolase [Planctomycetota bacterium]